MRVALIGNFPLDRQESMLRFTAMLSDGLRVRGHSVEVWSPEPFSTRLLPSYRYGGLPKYFGYFDKFVAFPSRIRRRLADRRQRPDVVHIIDHANAVYAPNFAGVPLVTTCHDLLQIRAARGEFPEHRLGSSGRRYQEWILRHIAKLPFAVCVSQQTVRDLQRLAHVPDERIEVIPVGLNYPYRPVAADDARRVVAELLQQRNLPADWFQNRGFILNVGGGQWYKNRRGLIDIYAGLRSRLEPVPRLALVGKPLNEQLSAHVRALGIESDVTCFQNVSNAQLESLYSTAEALLFPSWQEGFGWPVAEAQACGCPVFTSNRPPMTDVGGDGAEYIDPADAAGAAAHIASLWGDRRSLARRGLARSSEWNPELMFDRYLARYAAVARPSPVEVA